MRIGRFDSRPRSDPSADSEPRIAEKTNSVQAYGNVRTYRTVLRSEEDSCVEESSWASTDPVGVR